MRVRVLCVGTRMPRWVDDAVGDFLKRFTRRFPVTLEAIEASPRSKAAQSSEQLKQADSDRVRAKLRDGERLVLLDERGKTLDTRGFAQRIENWQMDGRDVTLAIGGADGHDDGLKQQADEKLSLSAMTLPHGLARVLLVEQLYRAWTLSTGHPYHRD